MGVHHKTVQNYLAKTGDLVDVIKAEIPTTTGLKTAGLIGAVTLYDMAFQYNLPLAKKMGAAGANFYLLGLSGYKVKIVESPVVSLTQMQMISAMALQIDEQDKQLELIKQQQALESARIDELTKLTHQHDSEIDRIFNPNGHYFSLNPLPFEKGRFR